MKIIGMKKLLKYSISIFLFVYSSVIFAQSKAMSYDIYGDDDYCESESSAPSENSGITSFVIIAVIAVVCVLVLYGNIESKYKEMRYFLGIDGYQTRISIGESLKWHEARMIIYSIIFFTILIVLIICVVFLFGRFIFCENLRGE